MRLLDYNIAAPEGAVSVSGGYSIQGYKGGKGGGGSTRTPTEDQDNLHSIAYASVIDLVSAGPIHGFVDQNNPLRSAYLDNTPIQNEDGSLNFQDVQLEFRAGTQDQRYIPGFPTAESTTAVNVELRSDQPFTRAIQNVHISGVRVGLSVRGLKQQSTKSGDISGYRVEYVIEISTDGSAFVEVVRAAFDGKTTQQYSRSHRVDLPRTNTGWSVRVRRLTPNSSNSTISDVTYVDSITEVTDAKLRRPMSACVGIRVNAKQFQSIPTRAYHLYLRVVRVPSNYDAWTRSYAGTWDGTFKMSWTDNPAWVFYDLATNACDGLGRLLPAGWVDRWALYQIARYCDELVPDGKGGTEPRFSCNVYLQDKAEAWKVLQDLASVFRGMAYYAHGSVLAVADMPRDAVYTYSNANVVDGQFNYTGSGLKTRYTVALVSWNDETDMGRAKVEVVEDPEGIARYGVRQVELTAFGCTSQGQAQRLGRSALFTSRMETESVTFAVGLSGTLAQPGQVIEVADAHLAGRRIGGLIQSATVNAVTLDAPARVSAGDRLTVVLPSGVSQTRVVAASVGQGAELQVIPVAALFSQAPQSEAAWSISAPDLATQKYRVLTVSEGAGLQHTITALQYVDGKHAAIDYETRVETPPISVVPPPVQNLPANVVITSYHVLAQGQARHNAVISWDAAANAVAYEVQWRRDNSEWVSMPRTGSISVEVPNIYAGGYVARVRAINVLDVSSLWATSALTQLNGEVSAPQPVTHLVAKPLVLGIDLSWGMPAGPNIIGATRIRASLSPDFVDGVSMDVGYPTNSHPFMGLAAGQRMYFWAQLLDKNGTLGPWYPEQTVQGVLGQSSADADEILGYLEGQIGESQLTDELLRPIQLVDQINDVMIPGLADDLARNAQALAQEKLDRANALAAETQARIDGDVASAQALTDGLLVEAKKRGAAIAQEKTERQAADSSLAGQIDTVTAAVGANAAAISQEAQARASGDSAEANQRQMLAAQLRGGHEGSDLDGVTSGLIAQEKAARTTQYEGLARQMTLLSAGVGEQFDHAKIWYFTGSTEGWSTATLVEGSWLRPNDSPGYTRSPRGLGINGAEYQQLRVRVRKVGAPTWDCIVGVYAPGATSYVAIKPAEPAWDENGIGMLVLSHEHTGTIDGLLLRGGTGRTATNYFAFDWVAVGRPAPGASSSALSDEATARATADSAEATKRETLSVKLTGKADPAGAALGNLTSGLIFDERQARVSGDEAVMTEVTGLKARMPAGGGKLATEASVTAEAQARASADSALASRSEALEARMPTGVGKVATAASVSTLENRVETVEGKTQANSSALTTVQSGLSTLSGAAGVGQNLLIHSDVELIRTTSTYLFGRYHLTEDFIPGQEYTLVTCVTHHKDPSDTLNSAVRVWAGGASNYVGEVARDVDRRIRVLRFTKNDRNDAPRELRFYYAPGPGTQPGEAIVHWAALYKGSVTPPLELPPRVEGLEVATEANAVATQELNTRVEQTEQNIMSAGQSITKIDARLTAKQDSDSLLPDYMMANPESWYSYYPNTDISSNFVQVADGRVAPTVFRFGAGRTYNFSVVTLPITRRYRVQAWMRRSADSDGHMRFTYKYRKTTDADSGVQTNYSSRTVTDQVPADGKWHLAEFVYVVPASLLNDGFTGIRFGFAINDTGTKGWAEIQGYCVTKVMQGADIDPAEVATAQSVSSLSGVVSEQGRTITSQGQAHTNLQNRVNDPKTGLAAQSAALSDLKSWTQLADGKFTAQANSINGLSAEVGNALASVALVQNALAETNGKLSATTTLKTEVHSGGKSYVAGISAGVVVEPGKPVQSEVLFLADRFGFLSLVNGVISTPFVIQNGQVFISQAFIGQSWIKSANIQSIDANKIESRNLAAKMASIGTAYVNRANIEHAAVDTLRIAGNAVAIHAGASADGRTLNVSESDLNVTIALPHMADVTISASVQGAGWGHWSLLEHQLRVNWISYGSIADVNNSGGAMVLKTRVAPGTHTFTLRQKPVGTGATATDYVYGQAGLSVICTMR